MSERTLPDDPADWPDDPYELLGVAPDVTARDLKRSYAKLIRSFKPEQRPNEFRRIREAYEFVLRLVDMGIVFRVAPPEGTVTESEPRQSPPVEAKSSEDPAEALWSRAEVGDERSAYAGLRELAQRQPQRSDLALRLHWLLRLFPEVDPGRDPCSWLIAAIREHGATGPAFELFQ